MRNIKYAYAFSLLLLMANFSAAQTDGSITVAADKTKILIGEQFHLKITAKHSSASLAGFKWPDTIPHFEIVGKPVLDSSLTNGVNSITKTYTLTSFDSGSLVIPAFSLSKKIQSQPFKIDVVFSDFNPEQPYHDIKDIIEVKTSSDKIPWWWYAIAALVTVTAIAIFARKKKKETVVLKPQGPPTDAYKLAMEKLQLLKQRSLSPKEYYDRLAGIFREFVAVKKGILSLQETTEDLLAQLKNAGLSPAEFEKLSQALRTCDSVKFAKYNPTQHDDEITFTIIEQAIKILNNN